MNNANSNTFSFFIAVLSFCFSASTSAEIYKYQDEHGRWHITDKAPKNIDAVEVVLDNKKKEKEKGAPILSENIAEQLHEKYLPINGVETASLSVVAIKTSLVEGSGFFVSNDGYILTNKHVVKPTETDAWNDLREALNERENAYRKAEKQLRNERSKISKMKKALDEYRKDIDETDGNYSKQVKEEEYDLLMERYLKRKKEHMEIEKKYSLSKKEYEKTRREFNIQNYSASLKKDFKIILKDDTELTARLIKVSKSHDLALLKLKNYETPFITPAKSETINQGMDVVVIGNPLGIKDVMTAGVVAGFEEEHVITDATVLPGNSGGPLLTNEGLAAGIVSLRLSQVMGGEGFGIAISIDTAFAEFSEYLEKK